MTWQQPHQVAGVLWRVSGILAVQVPDSVPQSHKNINPIKRWQILHKASLLVADSEFIQYLLITYCVPALWRRRAPGVDAGSHFPALWWAPVPPPPPMTTPATTDSTATTNDDGARRPATPPLPLSSRQPLGSGPGSSLNPAGLGEAEVAGTPRENHEPHWVGTAPLPRLFPHLFSHLHGQTAGSATARSPGRGPPGTEVRQPLPLSQTQMPTARLPAARHSHPEGSGGGAAGVQEPKHPD